MTIDQLFSGAAPAPYLIAEMSANHNQDYNKAVRLVQAAHAAGADAVKLQTYTPETMTIQCDNDYFRISSGTLWDGRLLYDLYHDAHTPWEWHRGLKDVAADLGMDFFSTAFDGTSADFLEDLGVPVHKIASFELPDLPLIEHVARFGKPLILSTGMATLEEIQEAVDAARKAGAGPLALLKCTSAYPASPAEMNLNAIPDLAARFQTLVGLSDHTLGTTVPVAATALGATIIEKHLTLSRADYGPDSAFSLEPHEFKMMADGVRIAHQALGVARYGPTAHEHKSSVFRRSLFVVSDVKAGDLFTAANVRSIRPGYGLGPKHYRNVLGTRAARDLQRGEPLTLDAIAG